MHKFEVWAPSAQSVSVDIEGVGTNLSRSCDGWWSADVEHAAAGTKYRFSLDGGDPIPDPRSPWQPEGIHGPSCIVDHSEFAWTDANWQAKPLASAIIYEMHVGTFTPEGTYNAAIGKLRHLVDLGVTHLELMPVNEFSGRWGWGYDGVDLFAPHHAYGTPDDLKAFVNAAHGLGLAVLLDVVYNHLGPAGNYLSSFGPYFSSRHRTPWGEAVNLDGPHSHQVRRFFCDNAAMWLRDYHFDGLRIDAVHALIDNGAVHFLEQLSTKVAELAIQTGRHLVLVAESDLNDPRVVHMRETGGYGMDAQWSDDFHHALHSVLTGEVCGYYSDFGTVEQLARCLRDVFVYAGSFSKHRQRPHGRPVDLLPGYRFLGYIQNHDQIGNRAAGERIAHISGCKRAKIAAGLVLTAPFVPMLFQGEEWAASSPFQYFTQHADTELGRAVSEGRRGEFVDFGWTPEQVPDPQDPATYQRSKLRWDEVDNGDHREMLEWYRALIRLRKREPALTDGALHRVHTNWSEEQSWLTVKRRNIVVCSNFGRKPATMPVHGPADVLLSSTDDLRFVENELTLGPETLAILRLQTTDG